MQALRERGSIDLLINSISSVIFCLITEWISAWLGTDFLSDVPREKNRELEGPETEEAMKYRQSEILSVLEKRFSIERQLIWTKLK
jgi:hypothetical protein